MAVKSLSPQLRTTDMAQSIAFYTEILGFSVAFRYQDFYAGISAGGQVFHLKLVDHPDPSIAYVEHGDHLHLYFEVDDLAQRAEALRSKGVTLLRKPHDTAWGTRELVIRDNQGHTLYFGQSV